jgi:hypothetical protein
MNVAKPTFDDQEHANRDKTNVKRISPIAMGGLRN